MSRRKSGRLMRNSQQPRQQDDIEQVIDLFANLVAAQPNEAAQIVIERSDPATNPAGSSSDQPLLKVSLFRQKTGPQTAEPTSSASAKPSKLLKSLSDGKKSMPSPSDDRPKGAKPKKPKPQQPKMDVKNQPAQQKQQDEPKLEPKPEPKPQPKLQQEQTPKSEPTADELKEKKYEEQARQLWEALSSEKDFKTREFLTALDKDREKMEQRQAMLKAQIAAYQTYGELMRSQLEKRDLGVVMNVKKGKQGKPKQSYHIAKLSTGEKQTTEYEMDGAAAEGVTKSPEPCNRKSTVGQEKKTSGIQKQ